MSGLEDNAPVDRPRTTEPPVRAPAALRPDRTGRVAGVVGLLIVVAVASALAGPWHPPINEARPIPWTPPTASTPPMPTPAGPEDIIATLHVQPWDLSWLGWTLAGAAIAWLLYMIMRWLVRHPAPKAEEGPDDAGIEQGDAYTGPGVALPNLPTLREGVVQADQQLRKFVRPADAVIAAWVRLEQAAARSGVLRDPAATPTEFTVKVLDRAPVDPEATRTLLGLYLRARFGGEQMTADDVTAAMAALAALAEGLGQPEDEL